MASSIPPRQRLADLVLGRPVLDFIAERRADGKSFRLIARDLLEATSGEVDITDMTVRAWHLAAQPDSEQPFRSTA